jgi:hypothetical protein
VTARPHSLAGACVLAGLLAGCGGTQLDGASIEKLLVTELGNRGYAHARVACPDVDNEVGRAFTCEVTGVSAVTKVEGSVARNDEINVVRLS